MKNPLRDLFRLFFPPTCAVCGRVLPEEGELLCTTCRWEMPLTGFARQADNPVARKFYGHLPLDAASSYYYFVHGSGFRDLIHRFKYQGGWAIAQKLGAWYGAELKESGLYGGIDLVVPIPLHWLRRLQRGYNQSEYLARGIASALGVPVESHSVVRRVYNVSQTHRTKDERWENVHGIFAVRHPERLVGRRLLLVDDVLTTGATLISCGETILRAVPDCRLSIATLAVARGELRSGMEY